MFKYPLASSTFGVEEKAAMNKVINSGLFTMGEHVNNFELQFSSYVQSKYAVMVNSGSSAVLLMIASLFYTNNKEIRLNRGDEIIVPAVSWSTTYFPLYQYGLKIKFVDIDLFTLNYDLNKLENAISSKTKAIMIVNLLGNPNDFNKINQIIANKKIFILEDNCESLGATYRGKFTGTFGLLGSYSTFFSHHMSTMEGGIITTNDDELYHILLSLRAHGWTRNLPKNNLISSQKSDDYFEESFRFILPGYNLRPLEIEGALGVEQTKKLPFFISNRQKNGLVFSSIMKNHEDIIIQKEIGVSSWFGFSLVIRPKSKLTRKLLLNKLNDIGFECRPIVAGNFSKNEVVKYFDYEIFGNLENAEHIDKNGLFIGNHHYDITDALKELHKL